MGEHEVAEGPEEIAGVVGARSRLGVVLHGESRRRQRAEPFDHTVVEVDMRRLGVGNGSGGHRIVVVLARDLDDPGLQALHRMVGAVVPERQLVGRPTQRGGQDLMAEADAEDRHTPHEVGHGGRRTGQGGGVTRAVGEEHAVGLEREHVVGRRSGRHHRDGAQSREQPHHGRLHPEVVGHHAQAAGGSGTGPRMGAGLRRGHARHQVQAVGADGRRRRRAQLRLGRGAECARHRPRETDVPGEAPGVDAGQDRDAVTAQERLQALGGPPVGWLVCQVAHHDPPAARGGGLVVGGVRPVVADV